MNLLNNSFGLGQQTVHLFPENLFKVGITKPNNLNRRLKMKQLKEQFKPITGYEGLYSISNYGYVISEAKTWKFGRNGTDSKQLTILKYSISRDGYKKIALSNCGKQKHYTMHVLVWDHFGDRLRNGRKLQVDHIDNDKLNCKIDNLQLLTQRQNTTKYYKTKSTTSKYAGVYWNKSSKRWRSSITINGKQIMLGNFINEHNAHMEYQKRLKEFSETGLITIIPRRTSSIYVGIDWNKKNNMWRSRVQIGGKRINVGHFTNEFDAYLARQEIVNKNFRN